MLEWRRFKPARSHDRIDRGIFTPWCHSRDEFVDGRAVVEYHVEVGCESRPFFGLVFRVVAAYVKDCGERLAHRDELLAVVEGREDGFGHCWPWGNSLFAPHEAARSAASPEILATAGPMGTSKPSDEGQGQLHPSVDTLGRPNLFSKLRQDRWQIIARV